MSKWFTFILSMIKPQTLLEVALNGLMKIIPGKWDDLLINYMKPLLMALIECTCSVSDRKLESLQKEVQKLNDYLESRKKVK